jgi:predicted permease
MSRPTSPPRLPRWVLTRLVGADVRGRSILGDLHEEWTARGRGVSAGIWYWRIVSATSLWYGGATLARLTKGRPIVDLQGDLRAAWRAIRRSPGTSSLIVATLALAIGTATVGFTFADLALFRGLPVDDSSRVVSVFASDTRGSNRRGLISGPDFLDIQERSQTLTKVSAFRGASAALIEGGESKTLDVVYASADLFAAMGQHAQQGRLFRPGDDRVGAPGVAVLSDRYWREAFSGRPAALGQQIQIGREIFTIVGVLSTEMEFGNLADIDVWLPLRIAPDSARDARNLRFIARLRDGTAFETAAAEIAGLGDRLADEYPASNRGWRVRLVPVSELTGGEGFWVVVALFLLSVGLLIAIATANVSNLVLVRAASRQREIAVRAALGARQGRLVRQLLVEGLMLSGLGAMLSLPVASLALTLVGAASSERIFQQLRIDSHELSFVAALMVLCPLAFSLFPARSVTKLDVRTMLNAGGARGATTSMRGRGWLVVAQVALAVVLLTASSLALRSVRLVYAQPLGIETAPLVIFTLDFNDVQYPTPEAVRAAARDTRERLKALPGVERVTMLSALPILGAESLTSMTADGLEIGARDSKPTVVVTSTTADGGSTLGLTMLAGTWWSETSDDRDPAATDEAVVSLKTAVAYLGGVDAAMGRDLTLSRGPDTLRVRVVGVSSDVLAGDRTSGPLARVWIPLERDVRRHAVVVKRRGPIADLTTGIRSVVAAAAPSVPIESLDTYDRALDDAASSDVVIIGVLTGFALLAVALAATGLFGVVSYTASQRTAEFGTRMALGATARDLIRLVAFEGVRLLAGGLAVGLAGGVAVGFAMRGLLFGLSPADPVALGSVIGLLAAVTLLAVAAPALRAARVNPVQALRE